MVVTRIDNAVVWDTHAAAFVGEHSVTIEADRIVDVAGSAGGTADRVIDADGRFLLPGLIDAHVHLTITTMDFSRAVRESPVEWSLQMGRLARDTLHRGFTTVRDCGGDSKGLVRAIERGLCEGPRVVRAGRVLSQTGGHGDIRSAGAAPPACGCEIVTDRFGHIADGADAVRKAVRHELAAGSDLVKVMASGGVASPSDPFDSVQYTLEELRSAVVEADHRHTYVTAHAYSPESIRLAVDAGVRCVEHANMLDRPTADHLADRGTIVVPTLVTYAAMAELGESLGLPAVSREKNEGVLDAGLRAVEIARAAGVELGLGSDLLGETQPWQNRELALRTRVDDPAAILRSMWITNAALCRLPGEIGTISPGAYADILLTRIHPLEELQRLADPDSTLDLVMAAGRVVVDRL